MLPIATILLQPYYSRTQKLITILIYSYIKEGDTTMGYKTKIQLIQRKGSQQWLFNIPVAIGNALELTKGETLDLTIKDKDCLIIRRKK